MNTENIKSAFLVLLVFEVVIMGSGQFISWNGATLRMFVFSLAILYSLIKLITNKEIDKSIYCFVLVLCTMHAVYALLGVLNGASESKVTENLKPLLYSLIVLPLYYLISGKAQIISVAKTIKVGGLLMAIFFLSLLGSVVAGLVNFSTLYALLSNESNEFMMSEDGNLRIFYKGFVYLGVSLIFFIYAHFSPRSLLSLIIILSALIVTFTRGFYIALALALLAMLLLDLKKKNNIMLLCILVVISALMLPFMFEAVGDRAVSDGHRIKQIAEVIEMITVTSLFVGHGYGVGVESRPVNMEIAFLEIFHKQGIVGLILWHWFFIYIIIAYKKIRSKENSRLIKPFICSTFFVYFQSMTNPYINNSMGMIVLAITFVALIKLLYIEAWERRPSDVQRGVYGLA